MLPKMQTPEIKYQQITQDVLTRCRNSLAAGTAVSSAGIYGSKPTKAWAYSSIPASAGLPRAQGECHYAINFMAGISIHII